MATAAPTRPKRAAVAKAPAADGADLYKKLVQRAKAAKLALVEHPHSLYSRIQVDGRTCAYIVRGKTVAHVYPQALAKDMPGALAYRTVELGSHHYGRGEVVVAVTSEEDIDNAVAAMKASVKTPAIPKAERAKKVQS